MLGDCSYSLCPCAATCLPILAFLWGSVRFSSSQPGFLCVALDFSSTLLSCGRVLDSTPAMRWPRCPAKLAPSSLSDVFAIVRDTQFSSSGGTDVQPWSKRGRVPWIKAIVPSSDLGLGLELETCLQQKMFWKAFGILKLL